MTPQRRRRIEELFAGAMGVDLSARESWLYRACGDDVSLRAEVARLLGQAGRPTRDRFLSASEPRSRDSDLTGIWHTGGGGCPARGPEPIGARRAGSGAGARDFSPKAAIVTSPQSLPQSEAESVVRARLRALPIFYILLLAMACFWRAVLLRDDDPTLQYLDVAVIVSLGGVVALLSSRWPIPIAWLRALELGVFGILAGRMAIIEYRHVISFSLRGDLMLAEMTVKNVALHTSILIVSYGLYVPKTWRRAAFVVGPLSLLPYLTLLVLYLRHPRAMAWLWEGWKGNEPPPLLQFGFDAMTLPVLALGSAFGAGAISRLRRQVAEARQLGQYRLRRQLGVGGMGEVYLAEHQLLKRPCALKLIRSENMADPKAVARFEREVRLTAMLSHPNTVEIYDYGRTEGGAYYYVMEYLSGLSLEDLVKRHGPLPPGRAVYLLRQVCGALREAHAAGLIHRDIKPSNIFAARRGGMDDVAKLFDFGLALPLVRTDSPQLSREGHILGTPQFMSPEQAQGEELDERSDIYSLGAVAYYLLTGRSPFDEEGGIRMLIAHARDPVVRPSLLRDGIPLDLELVVLRCLAKEAADRYPDAQSLGRALGECGCLWEWDQERAARWWRGADRLATMRRAVH